MTRGSMNMDPKARLTPFDVSLARDLECPVSAAKSLVVKDDNVWMGGLDACLRCWDLRMVKVSLEYTFQSQVHRPRWGWTGMGPGGRGQGGLSMGRWTFQISS